MKRFNREMWKWTRRIIIAELIFLMFSVIASIQRMPEIKGLEDQNPATSLGTYTSVSNPAEMLNDWDYDCATMSFNGSAFLHDYDFAIPAGYEVAGIRVTAYVAAPSGSTSLYLAIGKDENDTSSLVMDTMTTYGLSCSGSYLKAFVAGGPTDKWGMSWTPAEINNVNFTAYIENTLSGSSIYIDAVYVKIWYYASIDSDTFNMLETAVNLTANPGEAWTTIDASAYIPSDATGVILTFQLTGTTTQRNFKARMYGSTDNIIGEHTFYFSGGSRYWWNTYAQIIVGVDASFRFQFAVEDTSEQLVQLVGWTGANVVFRTNACTVHLNSTSWTDYDMTPCLISPSDTPKAAILWQKYDRGGYYYWYAKYYVRMNGGTDNIVNYVGERGLQDFIVGVDSAVFEQAAGIGSGAILASDFYTYLVGYVVDGPDFEANLLSLSSCTSTNTTCDLSSQVDANAITAIITWSYSGADPNTSFATVRLSKNYISTIQTGRNPQAGGASQYLSGLWIVDLNYDLTFWIHQRTNAGPLQFVGYAVEVPPGTTTSTLITTTTSVGGFDLPSVPDAIGDALGIGPEAGGMLLSFILFFMILVPLGMLTKNFWIILITGLTFAGFLTAIQWLPVWIMIMLCLIVALMLGSRLTGLVSRGGNGGSEVSDEGD